MRINLLGSPETAAYLACKDLIKRRGHTITYDVPDIAIAPFLTRILRVSEIIEPDIGVLIFHPSPLPYGRGASSIKWAFKRQEPITAATWFWANSGIDAGDICEQEIISIDHTRRPREFYESHIIPAMLRTLERALIDIERGYTRRIPQREEYASYDRKL
jgi:methionyl-tRNA formyltransferase